MDTSLCNTAISISRIILQNIVEIFYGNVISLALSCKKSFLINQSISYMITCLRMVKSALELLLVPIVNFTKFKHLSHNHICRERGKGKGNKISCKHSSWAPAIHVVFNIY